MNFAYLLLCIVGVPLLFPTEAFAYLDPGTGSVILQVVAAGVLGALFTIKSYWRSLLAFFSGRKASTPSQDKEAK